MNPEPQAKKKRFPAPEPESFTMKPWPQTLKMINCEQGKEKKELMKHKNQHKLPEPLNDAEDVYGDIIVFSNDLDAEPIDLPLKDWTDFLKVGAGLSPSTSLPSPLSHSLPPPTNVLHVHCCGMFRSRFIVAPSSDSVGACALSLARRIRPLRSTLTS